MILNSTAMVCINQPSRYGCAIFLEKSVSGKLVPTPYYQQETILFEEAE
jgi:hypothetical protein